MDSHSFGVAPRVGTMDTHSLVWPLELRLWTSTLWCGPSSWGDGHPLFGVTPRVVVMSSHSFGVAPRVGMMDFHALVWPLKSPLELGWWTPTLSVWPLELWCWTPTLRRGPVELG